MLHLEIMKLHSTDGASESEKHSACFRGNAAMHQWWCQMRYKHMVLYFIGWVQLA